MNNHLTITCFLLLFGCLLTGSVLAERPPYQHGISLLDDLKYAPDFEHFEYANPEAPKGGTLMLAGNLPIRNFSGAWGTGVANAHGSERTADRLFISPADEQSSMYGLIADGVALSEDGKSLYIRLHEKARWHDGTPITTRDIKFSWDRMDRIQLASLIYWQSWVESIDFLNDREFVIHHKEVFTHSNLMALTSFKVRPAHYYGSDIDPGDPTLVPPLGNGPYRVAEFDRNYVVYERVKDYWASDLPVNKGRHNFDTIRYDIYRDATVAREAFRKGLFDVYLESDVRYWSSSYDIPAFEEGNLLKDTRDVSNLIGTELVLTFNLHREMFQDVRVREALTLAFDFEWQNRVLRHNSQQRALSYFAGSEQAATGLPSPEEIEILSPYRQQLPGRVFTDAYELPVSTGQGEHRPALERAQSLLIEAGWRYVDDRLQNERGEPFRLEIAIQTPSARQMILPYINALSRLGIDARLRLLDIVLAMRFKRERKFDIYLRGHEFSSPPMSGLRGYFGSANAPAGMSGNLSGIHNPVVDDLIELAVNAPDLQTATTACRALDRVLLWGFYAIPLNMHEEERFLYWRKFGRPDNESVAKYAYLTVGMGRLIDTWWKEKYE